MLGKNNYLFSFVKRPADLRGVTTETEGRGHESGAGRGDGEAWELSGASGHQKIDIGDGERERER